MTEWVETIIIGAGQAGLAMSYHLARLGREHVILERSRVAERWRSERWDSLVFQFPNWTMRLPGHAYQSGDPDGFAPRHEVVRFIEQYAGLIKAPVRCGVRVVSLRQKPGAVRFVVQTDDAMMEASNVVVATGPFHEPAIPPFAATLPADVAQVPSSRYRNPAQLPPGGVLVVGCGASGCQIAEELYQSERKVYLSLGRYRRAPRRYRDRDIFWWLQALGILDRPADLYPEMKKWRVPLVTGVNGGHDIDLRRFGDSSWRPMLSRTSRAATSGTWSSGRKPTITSGRPGSIFPRSLRRERPRRLLARNPTRSSHWTRKRRE
jgi:putative flavoprotein involved in K+ transport